MGGERSSRVVWSVLLGVGWVLAPIVSGQAPFATERRHSVVTVGPSTVADPYAWLEATTSEEVVEWSRAQDAHTRRMLGPARRAGRLDAVLARHPHRRTRLGAAHRRGDVWYHVTAEPDGSRVIVRSDGPGGAERVLPVDGAVARSWSTAMIWPDPSGRYLVAGLGVTGGSTQHLTLALVDGDSGREAAPRIEGVTSRSRVHWLPDGSGFVYTARAVGDTTSTGPLQLFAHDIASGTRRVLHADASAGPGTSYWTAMDRDGRAVSLTETRGGVTHVLRVPLSAGDEPRVMLVSPTASPIGELDGTLFAVSTDSAPRGEVLGIDVADPDRVRTVVPEDPTGSILRGRVFGERIVLEVYARGRSELRIIDPRREETRTVELPYIGWMSGDLVGTPWDSTFSFVLEGVVDPGSAYTVDVATGRANWYTSIEPDFDASQYVTRTTTFASFDGTEVPIFLSYRSDSPPSPTTPVWLYAYGASGFPDAPWYQPQHRAFLDAGGAYVMPGVRGGGAKGRAWQRAGEGRRKQVGIADYLAAAEWLVDEGLADPDRIVANGNSAGGPLVASAALQQPERFAALLADFSYLDIVRGTQGANPTWGDPRDPDDLEVILSWSPYQLAQRPACYPPTLVSQGDRDSMGAYHAYKFVAALQSSQECDAPVLLQVAWGRGHTLGREPEQANQLAFLQRVLGMRFDG